MTSFEKYIMEKGKEGTLEWKSLTSAISDKWSRLISTVMNHIDNLHNEYAIRSALLFYLSKNIFLFEKPGFHDKSIRKENT